MDAAWLKDGRHTLALAPLPSLVLLLILALAQLLSLALFLTLTAVGARRGRPTSILMLYFSANDPLHFGSDHARCQSVSPPAVTAHNPTLPNRLPLMFANGAQAMRRRDLI